MTPAPLVMLAGGCLATGVVVGPRLARTWIGLTVTAAVAALGAAAVVLAGGTDWEWRSGFAVAGEPLHARLDAMSAIFLALVAVVGGASAVYSRGYWSDEGYPDSAPRGRRWLSAMVLAMVWVLLASNGLHFLIGWELFTVSAYFLVTLDRGERDARAAGWLYLAASHLGTLCLFAFFGLLAARTGSWELGPMRENTALAPLFWLALAGFAVKGGVFPAHVWLPSAHANAPSHVSALMSGVAIKMGIYGLVRFSGWLPVPAAAPWVVIGLGAVSAVLGIAFALVQNDLKRLLAYCSVENVGIILVGLGAAMLAATHGDGPWGRLALAGALLHVWNHGLAKSLLFFGAGSVLHATGTREITRLGGLWRAMPRTAGLFALGAVAICGLPPLNGFVGEWLVYLGLFDGATAGGRPAWGVAPAAIALATAGALALATFVKASAVVFLGAPRTKLAMDAHESGPWLWGPMLALAGLCATIGLAPFFFWPLVARAAGAWRPSAMAVEPLAPVATLGLANVVLALFFVGAAAWLWRRVHAEGPRPAPTWDCGYAAPTPRMQYTGGSFGGIAATWFSWALQIERTVHRPRGPFPVSASRVERVPESVLEWVVAPVAGLVMRASAAVRRLQHGRLQFYIVYLVAGLAGLGLLVLLEGNP